MNKWLFMAAACAAGLTASGASTEWVERASLPGSCGNLAFSTRWDSGRGLHLRIVSPDSNKTVQITLGIGSGRVEATPEQAFSPATRGCSRFNPEALPSRDAAALPLVLKFRQENWSLYQGDRWLADIPAPFQPPAVVLQPSAELPAEENRKTRYQKVSDLKFEDSFMRPEDSENLLGEWSVDSGTWYLHTALDTARENAAIKPDSKRVLQSEFSPNFYSLAGKGSNAVITAGYDFYDNYSYEAGVRLGIGEMGLVFYARDPGALYAFTAAMTDGADEAILTLWSRDSSNSPARRVLGAVTVKTVPGQWAKLRVAVFQGRIQCFMDQGKAIDVRTDLPAGGRFGLYADSPSEIRFDDVALRSTHDLEFESAADLRRHVLAENGAFFSAPRRFSFFGTTQPDPTRLAPPVSGEPQWLAVGSPSHDPHVFSARFETESARATVGLLAGYQGPDRPYYRFVCNRSAAGEVFQLESVSSNAVRVLETWKPPRPAGEKPSSRITLMFDASGGNVWRLYRNGELALVHFPAPEARGASGLYVGANTKTTIGMPQYRFGRAELFVNRYEKNNRYTEDPFMKHWASPEGQWLQETNGLTWYTGDFLGRYSLRMPYVPRSEIHLGVGEEGTNGERIVSIHDNALFLTSDAGAPLTNSASNSLAVETNGSWYIIQSEGRWVWATSGDKLLFKQALEKPMAGRRIRVAGFTTEQLKSSFVERYNVKDFLFNESLFDWTVNGGRWEIINRFQCDPRWSHMNGDGSNSLAALWAKLEIGGDFCVEMHAGQRHGWYERCGDLNMTVFNRDTTPGQGYTITCTGWDPDASQLYTTLYRNGVPMAKSDKYLVPRKREGNKRYGYEPLIAQGRDVHGAWYYMKFRRIGNKLEFYFDNELVFSVKDDQPLAGGAAGIWTFMNSMMVARVKVAAETIRARLPVFTPVDPAAAGSKATPAGDDSFAPYEALRINGKPLSLCLPGAWEADDSVGRLRLEWKEEAGAGPSFTARNVMGSGSMQAACRLPPAPLSSVAGWSFEVKRTPRAQFNFHFSVGRMANGVYVPERRFVHVLSGAELEKGPVTLCGKTAVSPSWTPVTAWLPRDWLAGQSEEGYVVQVEGFGNLQPSLVCQGLSGNEPGQAYAMRDFAEIAYGAPLFATATQGTAFASFTVSLPGEKGPPLSFRSAEALQVWAASLSNGWFRARLQAVTRDGASLSAPLAWIRLPERPAVSCAWHRTRPDSVAVTCAAPYPDPRFLAADYSLNGERPAWRFESFASRTAAVPRKESFRAGPVTVAAAGRGFTDSFSLAWKDAPARDVPVLLKLSGAVPFYEGVESREFAGNLANLNTLSTRIGLFDPVQGSYLVVQNTPAYPRLRAQFPVSLSLARYPLFQFRYRTDEAMARVSLNMGNGRIARISENFSGAIPVRGATNFVTDGRWHSWVGRACDAIPVQAFDRQALKIYSAELASCHSADQTGLYTRWDLDDLMFGPAVSSSEQLAFTPEYFDFDGVESVRMAVRAGPESYLDLTPVQAAALAWEPITNAAPAAPKIDRLPDGLCRLFIRAQSRSGRESPVTDFPFLLDRQPLQTSNYFSTSDGVANRNDELRLTFATGDGAPLDPENLKIKWQDAEAPGGQAVKLVHQGDSDTLSCVWPALFREQLKATTNGQTVNMVVAGIQDGAGNKAPDFKVPVTIDYAKDKLPPSLMPTRYPTNVLLCTSWENPAEARTFLSARDPGMLSLVRSTNEPAYLRVKGGGGAATLRFENAPWSIKAFPKLAFRMRRPNLVSTNGPMAVTMTLDLTNSASILVPLTERKSSPRYVQLPEPIAWRSNEWHSVFIDLGEALKNNTHFQNPTNWMVRTLSIRQIGGETNEFQLQNLFIYAGGKPADKAILSAYDISGMNAPAVTYESVDGTIADGAGFLARSGTNGVPRGWAVIRPRDKAGNLAMPVRIPVWSLPLPTGEP